MTARDRASHHDSGGDIALFDREPPRRASTPLRPWNPSGLGGWQPGTFSQPRRSSPVTTCRLSDCIHLAAEEMATMQRQAEEQHAADDGTPMNAQHWTTQEPPDDEDED